MLLLCSRWGKVVILNVFKTDINAFSSCVLGVFKSPVATPAQGLSSSLRLRFISENASLLCVFVLPPKVPLH